MRALPASSAGSTATAPHAVAPTSSLMSTTSSSSMSTSVSFGAGSSSLFFTPLIPASPRPVAQMLNLTGAGTDFSRMSLSDDMDKQLDL
ncbi:hypothetical protein HK105_201989 [Polyrhizophydium stewartii]|uniref:Secreted protein n=1 Tax=Polyrhizophydium stewartii TaxID=2732419 RepID=A0ABR4NGC8_9FUNG